jgi:sugar lactone lactonase YvrE/enterochelin esterase-like enzyme
LIRHVCFISWLLCAGLIAAQDYDHGPDSERQPGVPQGKVTQHRWSQSKVYPGTVRDYWVYVPAQYDGSKPAALMVFQDGASFAGLDRAWRTPIVLDNLIHKKEMPVSIGIFVDPGVLPALSPERQDRYNRSFEYDALGDRYARFLIEEIIPEVGKKYKISADPNDRGLAGSSSGGIAAFTAAWNRPDAFRRVLSFIGSYTNLRGGDTYINLVRKMEPKPLRVFLQDGRNDLNLYSGSWWHANEALAAALDYAGYEHTFVAGHEAHNSKHGSAILPDALRWLWQKHPAPVRKSDGKPGAERHFITDILDPQSEWELVSEGHQYTEGPAIDRDGNVFFSDVPANKIFRVGHDGKVTVFKEESGRANGMMFAADGRLIAAGTATRQIVAWAPDGHQAVLAEDVTPNDVAVGPRGEVYFTEPSTQRVWYIAPGGKKRVVHEGLGFPNGVVFSPDHGLLYVADAANRWVWSFQVQPDGSLEHGQPFYRVELHDDDATKMLRSAADGMTIDSEGFLYVATNMGIQVFDQPGRVVGIISSPGGRQASNVVFGGPGLSVLYATARDKVYRRNLRRNGVWPWSAAKPPKPRL